MINGIGVLGWGVGGIEAEAAMLGQPSSMLIPQVVGFKLTGKLPEGATATDLVLTVTQMLRAQGVVGKFVEFYRRRPATTCRWPTARRSPTWRPSTAPPAASSRSTREVAELPAPVRPQRRADRAWSRPMPRRRACGARRSPDADVQRHAANWTWATCKPSLAGPKRPQDRVLLDGHEGTTSSANLEGLIANRKPQERRSGKRMDAEGGDQPQAEHLAAKPKSKIRIQDQDCRPAATARWSSPRSPPAPTPPTRR